jgi:hypothetical protein
MKLLTEKGKLPELKRRIKGALINIEDVKLVSEGWVVNGNHTIHFTIRNKEYLLKGIAMRKVS